MAEAFLNTLRADKYEAYSAGITPTEVNQNVVKVMAEDGIDISKNHSKSIEDFRNEKFSYVVTVCDGAKEACPFFPGEKIIHTAFKDPSGFKGSEQEKLKQTRQVRDEIKEWIKSTFN
jgi:arsenate reductase